MRLGDIRAKANISF
uniref:Uncharacterized protein n=1 Tax=Rhizophora mucronata TaxID=61149 RepID=A0A2P2P6H6_RHIMU